MIPQVSVEQALLISLISLRQLIAVNVLRIKDCGLRYSSGHVDHSIRRQAAPIEITVTAVQPEQQRASMQQNNNNFGPTCRGSRKKYSLKKLLRVITKS